MSDSSEEEDLSRFREAVDSSFTKLIQESKNQLPLNGNSTKDVPKPKSERYLDIASHYNDVKVPEQLQKQIGAKISAIITKNIEFVDVDTSVKKKHKIKGGVKLFKDSPAYLTSEAVQDTYTEAHNAKSKKLRKMRRRIDPDEHDLDESEKIHAAAVTGDYIISKEETKSWKSRRKEKLFKYKSLGKGKMLVEIN